MQQNKIRRTCKKRHFCCLLVVSLMLLPLVSVGASAAELKSEITVWAWSQPALAMASTVPDFNEKYPGVKVNIVELPWVEVHNKLLIALSVNSGAPDVSYLEGIMSSKYAGEHLLELTDKLEPFMAQIVDAKWGEVHDPRYPDKKYGVPTDVGPAGMYYRVDFLEEAGIEGLPETWDEFRAVGRKLKAQGKYLMSWDYIRARTLAFYYFRPLLLQLQSGYYDKYGNVLLGDEASVQVTELLYDLVNTDQIVYMDALYREPPWWSAIKSGDIGAIFGGAWMAGLLKFEAPELEGAWTFAPVPAFEKGGNRATNQGGASVCIPAQSKNQEAAWEFVKNAFLTKKSVVAMYKEWNTFPVIMNAYDDPVFSEPDPYFGGQQVGLIWTKLATEIASYYYMPTSIEDEDRVNLALIDILQGKVDIQEGLNQTAEAIKESLKRLGIPAG